MCNFLVHPCKPCEPRATGPLRIHCSDVCVSMCMGSTRRLRTLTRAWPWHRLGLALALILPTFAATAHDTWFEARPSGSAQWLRLALGTGTQFPIQQIGLGIAQLRRSGCRSGDAAPVPLQQEQDTGQALLLRARLNAVGAGAGVTCWAQTQPYLIELPPDKVALYLHEIQASAALRAAWAAMQERGEPWTERYTKHARIEIDGYSAARERPSGMDLDVRLLGAAARPRAGDELVFQVLRDGVPLAGLAVELRSAQSPLGLWRRTDADGRVALRPPLAGRWVLRATDLRPAAAGDAVHWESRFVTLAFELGERSPPLKTATASD